MRGWWVTSRRWWWTGAAPATTARASDGRYGPRFDRERGEGDGLQVFEPRQRRMGRGELREISQREELPAGDHGAQLATRGPRRCGRDPCGGESRAPEHSATAQRDRVDPGRRRDLRSAAFEAT